MCSISLSRFFLFLSFSLSLFLSFSLSLFLSPFFSHCQVFDQVPILRQPNPPPAHRPRPVDQRPGRLHHHRQCFHRTRHSCEHQWFRGAPALGDVVRLVGGVLAAVGGNKSGRDTLSARRARLLARRPQPGKRWVCWYYAYLELSTKQMQRIQVTVGVYTSNYFWFIYF